MVKSAIHIHSIYSDGEFSLTELRKLFLSVGCQVVFLTDHAEYFDENKIQRYIEECKQLSTNDFQFIAGLEYECENKMHILGLGCTSLIQSNNPQEVIRQIKEKNSVAIIAHPLESMFNLIRSFIELPHGIEVWNTKYDGRSAPRSTTFNLLYSIQDQGVKINAFYGQDLHWKNQYSGLFTKLHITASETEAYLEALKSGAYSTNNDQIFLPSNGKLPYPVLHSFSKSNAYYMKKRKLIKSVKKRIDALHLVVPDYIKSQLRRIY